MAFEPVNELEESFARAAANPGHRPQFYRDLLASDILAIQQGLPPSDGQVVRLPEGTSVRFPVWETESGPTMAIFTSLARLQEFTREPVGYVQMNGRAFMEMNRGYRLLINPASDYRKEVLPAETESLLDGSIWKQFEHLDLAGKKALLGEPARYPDELVAVLKDLFKSMKQVRRAYVGLLFVEEADDPPHTLVGLDVTGDFDRIAGEVILAAKAVTVPDPPVDYVRLSKGGWMADYFEHYSRPFYERKKFLGLW